MSFTRYRRWPAALVVAALLACAGVRLAAAPQSHQEGAIGPGSMYAIDVPADWNGDLVLYAHGIVQADLAVALPTDQDGFGPVRDALLAAGYAVAASSYSSTGWALEDAVQRTHQLGKIFTASFAKPRRVFLAGHSLGALAIVKMAETYPTQYAGALPMCGPLGGALPEIGYVADARVTLDFYFPGLLPGTPLDVPEGTVFEPPTASTPGSPLFWKVYSTLFDPANQGKLVQWALAAKLPFADANELGVTALYVIGFELRYTNDLVQRVNGKTPYDNSQTIYQVNATADPATNAFLSAQLNQGVARYEADPAAINFYTRNYAPSGRIGIPVLTLHTTRDPAIPIAHEDRFAGAVALAGRSNLLRQHAIDAWGHCAFTTDQMLAGFNELVSWVDSR
jgi:pimeloyl-ACP methyl ester carboxylesterase